MKKYNTEFLLGLLLTVIGLVMWLLATQIDVHEQKYKATIDSLQNEISIRDINIGRYEITLELLSQEDEPAAAKFDSILQNETE